MAIPEFDYNGRSKQYLRMNPISPIKIAIGRTVWGWYSTKSTSPLAGFAADAAAKQPNAGEHELELVWHPEFEIREGA